MNTPVPPATRRSRLLAHTTATIFLAASVAAADTARPDWFQASRDKLVGELGATLGTDQRPRLERGIDQVGAYWRDADGDAATFEAFVRTHWAAEPATRDSMFARFERLLEKMDGHLQELGREFRVQSDLDIGPILPFDELFAAYDPAAHTSDDFFQNKLAFVVLLNFPLTTLEQRLAEGERWTRREWAETRLAHRFSKRIPAEVNLEVARAASESESYISGYNVWMHHVLDRRGKRLFPAKLRLLSHWNLRDEIKANYSEGKAGLPKQRILQQVMERIVTQTIPAVVVDNPHVDWNPYTNDVRIATAHDTDAPPPASLVADEAAEPDTRYARLLDNFKAARLVDPYSPTAPTLIARRFDENREIPEERVRAMLEQVLTSPLVPRVGKLIEKRLGRKLEPFDVWYNGFKERGRYTEAELDAVCKQRYPTPEAYAADLPNLFEKLGFSPERARFLAGNIAVDPARGSGHALGAAMRSVRARLRTRVGADGMDYKGYNIAVHEMGHNVEQTFSLDTIDHTLLAGVPNNAFTEALAFVFQGHDIELLGLATPTGRSEALKTLNDFWGTFEIAGVALVDMAVWHWMYDHPTATPAELKDATIQISKDVWNRFYAPVFRRKDVVLLGVYSHMISYALYLPDYPIGHLIAFQVEEQMRKAGAIGPEFERMSRAGNISPDVWMRNATGAPVGADALLVATERALGELAGNGRHAER
jgi:hypothetical protein